MSSGAQMCPHLFSFDQFQTLECTFVHLYITVNLALIWNYCSGSSFKSNSVYHDS